MSDGDLGGLVKNVAHERANSISKLLKSASSGIGRATLDEKYDEKRLMISKKHLENSQQHLVAAQDRLSGVCVWVGPRNCTTIGVLDLFLRNTDWVKQSLKRPI